MGNLSNITVIFGRARKLYRDHLQCLGWHHSWPVSCNLKPIYTRALHPQIYYQLQTLLGHLRLSVTWTVWFVYTLESWTLTLHICININIWTKYISLWAHSDTSIHWKCHWFSLDIAKIYHMQDSIFKVSKFPSVRPNWICCNFRN